jgi:rhodanese-related sulfurtransferase
MNRSKVSLRLPIAFAAILGFSMSFAQAQFLPPGNTGAAFSIPQNSLMQPKQLNDMLQKPTHEPLLIFQVGSHLLFAEAHVPGSEYAGPGSQPAGQQLLRNRVGSVPKNKLIVLYCGCCPWEHCPNIAPAYRQLIDMGFTNVKVLYLASNFGDDWVAKGYRVEKGQ